MVLPLVGNVPLQPPEAVHELALEAFHCSVTDEPMATLLSFAFKLTNGGATTAGVVGVLPVVALLGAVLPLDVCASELAPHAASEPSAANTSMDFNAYANLKRRLRRIELIRVSQDLRLQLCSAEFDSFRPQSLRSHIHSLFRIRQPVAICELHMFSYANELIGIFENRKCVCASRIGDTMRIDSRATDRFLRTIKTL